MNVIMLGDIDATTVEAVGGKAAGLGEMLRAGERVPEGFCLTTAAYRSGEIPEQELMAAYRAVGGPAAPVAVRSSATAEDLPEASFAGQQETVLDVTGTEALLAAVRTCWASLNSARARAYRDSAGVGEAEMAVVVQRMVPARTAGVLFTANPLTGRRTEMVVDAAPGPGTGVVDGTVRADHYVLGGEDPPADEGCLGAAQLAELRAAGERLQKLFGAPQDVEWAFDAEGVLWLLQSRPITTLFPLPPRIEGPQPRVLMESGHMQGMLRPFTPMGLSVLVAGATDWAQAFGLRPETMRGPRLLVEVAGRLYVDLSDFLRSKRMRSHMPEAMQIYGPRVVRAMRELLDDPRFAPRKGRVLPAGAVARVVLGALPPALTGTVRALARPGATVRRMEALAEQVRARHTAQRKESAKAPDAAARVRSAARLQGGALMGEMMAMLPPLWSTYLAHGLAGALLKREASQAEVDAVLRGAPHNVTTTMDLELWRLAEAAREHKALLPDTPPEEIAAAYRRGELPDFGLADFLERYGHRSAAEVDIGMPRWAEDPAPVFAALANYLRSTDPEQAPDVRFRRAAAEAEAAIEELTARARGRGPLRAALVRFLLHRSRELAGLRELPKFVWLYPLAEIRRLLLDVGAGLAERGLLHEGEDIMFLDLAEAEQAAGGLDLRAVVAERRRTHERELRRRRVPGLLLSDGTDVQAALSAPPAEEGALAGVPAAPGRATGRARVVHDPGTARIEPGEVIVAPTTDPGWTPLFLTAAALVTETGSPMAHGPTVAREYGIPAVICVPDATQAIADGQVVTVDGSAGTVVFGEGEEG